MVSLLKFIPNFLSVLRVLLLVPLVYYIKSDSHYGIIIFSLLIIATDYMDGFLARKWQTTSVTGRILDPLADKICISAVGVALTIYKGFPLYLLLALVSRDVIILLVSLFSIVKLKEVPASNIIGKFTAGVVSFCLVVFLFNIEPLKQPSIVTVIIMIPVSLISYGLRIIGFRKPVKKT